MHGVVEHGRFGDVFFCEILRPKAERAKAQIGISPAGPVGL